MDDELFTSITKYLKDESIPRNKNTKKSQAQQERLAGKYKLVNGLLVFENQNHKRIVLKSQYYSLIYTFHNDPIAGHLGYKKIL